MVGGAVLQEALRQLCVYKVTALNTGTGESKKFFEYVLAFSRVCGGDMTKACSERVQKQLKISKKATRKCVSKSGGAEYDGGKNKMFEKELKMTSKLHVLSPATLLIDRQEDYKGRLDCPKPIQRKTCSVLMKLCSRIQEEEQPQGCTDEFWRQRAAVAVRPDLSTASPSGVVSRSVSQTVPNSPGVTLAIQKIEQNQAGMQNEMVYGLGFLLVALCAAVVASRSQSGGLRDGYTNVPAADVI